MTLGSSTFNLTANNHPALNINATRNNINHGCSYFVVIDYGTASSYSNRVLTNGSWTYPVQIYKDSGHTLIVKNLADSSSASDILDGVFLDSAGATSETLTYHPSINPSLYSRFGTYTQNYSVSLYEGTLASHKLSRTRVMTLIYTQPKKIDLSLVDTSSPFNLSDTNQTLNFGTLSSGSTRGCDLVVGYNAGYLLQMSSANNGNLKHTALPTKIGYTLTINGSAVNLSSGTATVSSNTGISPAGGLRLPISATIGSVTGKNPGNYSDTITVSVVSIE